MKILGGKKQKETGNITQDKDLKQIKQLIIIKEKHHNYSY